MMRRTASGTITWGSAHKYETETRNDEGETPARTLRQELATEPGRAGTARDEKLVLDDH